MIKPILFNTEMVRAILDGRKMVTRRVIKAPYDLSHYQFHEIHDNKDGRLTTDRNALCAGFYTDRQIFYMDGEKHIDAHYYTAPYKPGDTLYVRETWNYLSCSNCDIDDGVCSKRENGEEPIGCYIYKADGDGVEWDDGKTHWRPSIFMPKEAARIWLFCEKVEVEQLGGIKDSEAIREGFLNKKEFFDTFYKLYPEINEATWVWKISFKRTEKLI